ncbi:MAG: hypothetical protein KZQ58_09515 [gamma proteobacterium symbiont of Bathyaustriella thionipta]|nr:hypothetical protein [gamma proteobacterium symbiont of Bathyaustriella thionipta]
MLRLIGFILLCMPFSLMAADKPLLYGYGVRHCSAFMQTWRAAHDKNRSEQLSVEKELPRYRQWFSGLISGLSLTLGYDVLRGLSIDDALKQVNQNCNNQPDSDFFNASMALIRLLEKVHFIESQRAG